jgi:hypothetical protein
VNCFCCHFYRYLIEVDSKNETVPVVGSGRSNGLSAWDRLRRAEKGEVVIFQSRYGAGREGFFVKAVCVDREKLLNWAQEMGLPEGMVFIPDAAMPSVTLTGKTAREVLKKW